MTETIPDPVMPARSVLLLLVGILAFPPAVSLVVKYLVLPWLD